MNRIEIFTKGLYKENPVFKLVLGMCPTLAVTMSLENGFMMGAAVIFVLLCSNILVSLLRNFIPKKVRIPAFILIIASFVIVVELIMHAYFHEIYKALGIFIPLIVVNCIMLGRAEAFASKNSLIDSILDALGMGFGFLFAMFVLSSIREILGSNKFFGYLVIKDFEPMSIFLMPPGGFICLGLILAFINWRAIKNKDKEIAQACCTLDDIKTDK